MSTVTPVVFRTLSSDPEKSSGPAYAEQVRHLYRLSPAGYLGTLVNASIVMYALWDVVDNAALTGWFIAVMAITGGRYLLYRAYGEAATAETQPRLWANLFFAGATAMGCMWGVLGTALFPHQSMPHQFLVIFVIGGMVMSAAGVLSTVKRIFYGFTLPAVLPLTMMLFAQGQTVHVVMGMLVVVYTVVILAFAAEMRSNVLASTRIQEDLRQATQKLQALVNASPLAIIVADAAGRIERWNPAAERIFGWNEAEVLNRAVPWYPAGKEQEGSLYRDAIMRGEPFSNVEAVRLRKDGTPLTVSLSGAPIFDDGGAAVGVMVIAADITARKRFETRQALQNAITGLLAEPRTTVEEALTRVIQVFCEKVGWACGSRRVLDPESGSMRCAEAWGNGDPAVMQFVAETRKLLTPSTSSHVGVTRRVWDSGKPMWITDVLADGTLKRGAAARKAGLRTALAFPIMIGDQFYGVMEYFAPAVWSPDEGLTDFAGQLGVQIGQFIARRQAESELRFVATHDTLTALPNRAMFGERLSQALAQARRYNRRVAVLFVDLDGFKEVNDTNGHDVGDALLKEIAVRLRGCLREGDVIGRIGGDEFVVLIEEFDDVGRLTLIAPKILDTVARPVTVRGQECRVTSSVGISAYPQDGRDSQTLLRNADSAMYRAKELGKNRFVLYSL
ncbi:MAG TPA: diguanylate cyclase [Burkholderiales bacterium]|nr:diguanylate cyclase [Burkholderiales bacterium]